MIGGEIPYQLKRRTSINEDAVSRKGVDYEIPPWLERGTKHFFYKGVKTSL